MIQLDNANAKALANGATAMMYLHIFLMMELQN